MTIPRLRQLVIAAPSLEVAATVQRVLGLGAPYADPGVAEFGLENAVFALGDQFLEVVAPTAPGTAAGRFLARGGAGGYMAIVQTDDLAAMRARIDGLGIRRVWNIDQPDISASHLHPADLGGAIVSIDEAHPSGSWRWGGPDWRESAVPGRFTGAVVETPDPDALAARWALVLGLTVDERRIFLSDAIIAFREGPADRLVTFGLDWPNAERVFVRAMEAGLPVHGREIAVGGITLEMG